VKSNVNALLILEPDSLPLEDAAKVAVPDPVEIEQSQDANGANPATLIEDAEARTKQAETRTRQADTRRKEAEGRTDEANIRTEQAEARTVKAILASELRYRRLFETAQDGILILDADTGQVVDANPFMKDLLGYSQKEFLGKKLWEIGPFKGEGASKITFSELQCKDRLRYEGLPLETKEGKRVEVEFISNAYLMDEKLFIQCNIRDITERKRVEARFRRLVDSNAQGVMFWNTNGKVTGANDAFLRLVRYTREDLEAGRINSVTMTPREYAGLDLLALKEITASGACSPYEKEFIRKDATRVSVLLGAAAFEDNPKEGVCFILDLTERKKLEHQFLRAQRMESIGMLAGGVAHDLNNILAPIILSIEMLKGAATDSKAKSILETIEVCANRGADIVRQVLSFARGVEGEKIDVQLTYLLNDLQNIITETFPKDIQLRFAIPNDIWTIFGDPTQLHQILLNLCVNARDAMPTGGTLTISAENCVIDEQYAAMNSQAKVGRYVSINVTDSGTGMPQSIIDKMFEPFFTTKELSKGTGLGLSTVMVIVKNHDGMINVYSKPGQGTTFIVHLPAMECAIEVGEKLPEALTLPRGNGETILVVDDEASIVAITSQTLQAFGYRVLTAKDGADAVAIYAEHSREIAVVLTDMMMPIMDGAAVSRVLRRINPAVKIISASGRNANAGSDGVSDDELEHFLMKPYTAATLLKALRTILDEA
jgi:PAS domain S-box-containing protein